MNASKFLPTESDVDAFLSRVEPEGRREDALWLDEVFRDITGWDPVLWGNSIVGYGAYKYRYATGREGSYLATGFAPRKTKMVLYIMPGYQDYSNILGRLGPHKLGKSCVFLGRLTKINENALRDLIRAGLGDLAQTWPLVEH